MWTLQITWHHYLPDEIAVSYGMNEEIYGVGDYLDLVNQKIAEITVIVEGEITSVSDRGHIYFEISESKNGQKAILNCALWEFRAKKLAFTLKVGEKVQIIGKGSIYKPYGKFTFVVEQIMPTGEGALKQAFEKLKKDLQQKGYFDKERKRLIPPYITNIGVLTSRNGDALKDFRTHLGNYGFRISHLDCRVEGIRSIDEIVNGIRYLNAHFPELEVLVLTRGGGSLESLQAYNSLEVAEAIFTSKIPVLSAVGHENDITIADLVADVRASTPTAAGQLLSAQWREAQQIIKLFSNNLDNKTNQLISQLKQTLNQSWNKYCNLVSNVIFESNTKLSRSVRHLTQQINWRIDSYKHIEKNFYRNYRIFDDTLLKRFENTYYFDTSLNKKLNDLIKNEQKNILFFEKRLHLADPTLRLRQGYSIIRDQNKQIVKSSRTIKEQDELHLQFYSGTAVAVVSEIREE